MERIRMSRIAARGKVAVDGHFWLHKCMHASCVAHGLRGPESCTKFVIAFINLARNFFDRGIKLVFVFDGPNPYGPKSHTNSNRHQIREDKLEKARKLYNDGDYAGSFTLFSSAVKITPFHVAKVIEGLREVPDASELWEAIVAPFEADGQIVSLFQTGYIFAALAEDGDLLLHGVPLLRPEEVMPTVKEDNVGGEDPRSIAENKLDPPYYLVGRDAVMSAFPLVRFCDYPLFGVLCGCDYLNSPDGIGPSVAYQAILQHLCRKSNAEDAAMPELSSFATREDILEIIKLCPKHSAALEKSKTSCETYASQVVEALDAFVAQPAFCVLTKKLRLTGVPIDKPAVDISSVPDDESLYVKR